MSVASKIALVMKSVGVLSKDGRLTEGAGYRFLSEEKVTGELHAACAEVGLVLVPVGMEILTEREDTTSSNKILHNVRILARFRFIDPDGGDSVDVCAIGEGSDLGDKTLNKCMTAALKYVLRQSFLISTGDDPDHVASEETTASRALRRVQPHTAVEQKSPSEVDPDLKREFNQLIYVHPEWMQPDGYNERGQEKKRPTSEFFQIIKGAGLPNKWSTWSAEQYREAIAAFTAALGQQPELPVAAGPPDTADPFADE